MYFRVSIFIELNFQSNWFKENFKIYRGPEDIELLTFYKTFELRTVLKFYNLQFSFYVYYHEIFPAKSYDFDIQIEVHKEIQL